MQAGNVKFVGFSRITKSIHRVPQVNWGALKNDMNDYRLLR